MATDSVERYLRELEEELRDLPSGQRRELLNEIREHIGDALAEEAAPTETEIRNVLDRLGEPSEIAAEARSRFGIQRAKPGFRETAALILLPIGGIVVPVIGWMAGAILLAGSQVWTSREKIVGLLVVPGGLLPAVLFGLVGGGNCVTTEFNGRIVSDTCGQASHAIAYVVLGLLVVAPIWTVFFLASRLRRSTAVPAPVSG